MSAWTVLLSTDVGLMSLGGMIFMLGMGVFYLRYFLRHMKQDGDRAAAEEAKKR